MNLKNLYGLAIALAVLMFFASCQEDSLIDSSFESPFGEEQPDSKRVCLSAEHTKHLLQDPTYKKLHDDCLSAFRKLDALPRQKANCSSPVLVPVAIHYQGVTNPDEACLRQMAVDQIDRVNADYAGENSDISNWSQASSRFSGVSNGEMCVRFVIGDQNHPAGYGLANGDLAITVNRTQGDQVNNWAGYVNIFVQFNTGALGYAPLGGVGNGDGVVIDAVGFGAGAGCGSVAPEAPYNLGRTLTHELGHYLLLDHIWGDGCGVDDEVSDTPDQASDNSGCPGPNVASCGSADLHMNYMDYTNDACMYMFSAGQVSRMANYLQASLGSVTANASNVYSGNGGNGDGNGGGDPTCATPLGLIATVLGQTSARVNWNAVAGGTGYEIRYRQAGQNDYQVLTSQTTAVTIQGLSEGTQYQVGVRALCGTSNAAYTVDIQFITDTNNDGGGTEVCDAPGASTVTVRNPSSVLIDWADVVDAIRYQVQYRLSGTGSWTRKGGANSQKVLSNLLQDEYEYRLRTRCVDGWTAWTDTRSFDLGTGGGSGSGNGSYKIVVTLDDFGSETSWVLYDASNNLVESDGPFEDGQSGTKKEKSFDLVDGCYEVDLYDAFGDGICCDYGEGRLEVLDDSGNRIAYSDGNFGTYELIQFCVENGQARLIRQDKDAKRLSRGKKAK